VKRITHFTGAVLASALLLGTGFVGPGNANAGSASPLDQLIPLVGEWEGTTGNGAQVRLTYTLVSGGSALMERMQPSNETVMITIYTAEGDHLRVTHYCSMGNQPEMETAAITGKAQRFSFELTRVKGMKKPDEGHMTNLVLTMVDKDHLTQEWTFLENGKKQSELFKYMRKS
jgi:hypothetical protein